MDWHEQNRSYFDSDIDRFCFQPGINTVIEYNQYNNPDRVQYEVQKLPDLQLRSWLKHNDPRLRNVGPFRGMRIVISNRACDASIRPADPGAETLSHLPFSRETFLELMDQFHLSHSFVRTVLRGGIHFSSNLISDPQFSGSLRCFNMRMDNSWSRDLAMSASTEIGAGMTHALFHGCDEQDVKILSDWFRKTTHSAGHPMLLPALFAELQLRRHKRQGQKNWNKLVKLYSITGQYKNHVPGSSSASFREDQIDYDNTTREILGMHQDTSFLEKSHMKFPRTLKQMLAQLAVFGINAPQARTDFIATESARIGLRLDEMINDYEGLIENCKLVTDGASLLTGAIWNLIAQNENIVNQSIAADSRELAAAARRDSSAMKTIAVLTMAFLPGTFVAAFFSMPLLNWQAPIGMSILSDRFWIYWVVAIPLTAGVLLLWSVWYLLSGSQRAQDRLIRRRQSRRAKSRSNTQKFMMYRIGQDNIMA